MYKDTKSDGRFRLIGIKKGTLGVPKLILATILPKVL